MAVSCVETWGSRKIVVDEKSPRIVLTYFVYGTTDENLAYDALANTAPGTYDGLTLKNVELTCKGGPYWDAACTYQIPEGATLAGVGGDGTGDNPPGNETQPTGDKGLPAEGAPIDPGISVSIGGSTQHVTQSLETVASQGAGAAAIPDFKGAIGVSGTGPEVKVEGVDVLAPHGELSITRVRPFITLAYIKRLWKLVGKTNAQPWWGFGAEELLFLGAEITARQIGANQGGGWSIVYKFGVSFTEDQILIGDILLGAGLKRGWHYLWVKYKVATDANLYRVEIPHAVYVERVYATADFGTLLIGGV